ncbi:hypothetical protein LX36DRAFT_666729 [Colletotrichum falcatum]|nr:hypothetical protein LX36DRAFT_666729 [Colletotrichum falcatum]
MPPCIRVADVLLLLLISQTTQAGPYRLGSSRHHCLCLLRDGTRGPGWSHSNTNLRDPRWHDYQCSSRITASNHTRRSSRFNNNTSSVDLNPGIPVNTNNSVSAGFATSYVEHHLPANLPHNPPTECILFVSCTANVEAPSASASSTTIAAAPTTASAIQTLPETSSIPLSPSSAAPLSTLSSTLQVTGTPNNQVPTIRTSTPAASATISPEVATNNLASAKTFNTLFASLNEQSACTASQIACVKGNVGICGSNGAFAIQSCGSGTSCFALPMSTTEGVIVGCYDPKVASGILGTPVSAPVPGSSTSASEATSKTTTTITPTIIATTCPYTLIHNDGRRRPTYNIYIPPSHALFDGRVITSIYNRRDDTTSHTVEINPDTLIVNPIPTDEPSEPPTDLVAGTTPSATPPPSIDVPQGTPTLTVFVTVTQKERETVTVTVTKG